MTYTKHKKICIYKNMFLVKCIFISTSNLLFQVNFDICFEYNILFNIIFKFVIWWDIAYYGFYQNPCLLNLLWALATDSFSHYLKLSNAVCRIQKWVEPEFVKSRCSVILIIYHSAKIQSKYLLLLIRIFKSKLK